MATPEDIKVVDENSDTRRPVTVRVEQVTVRILPTIKSGRPYWLVEDYSSDKRRLLNAKSLPAARAKAKAVAEAVAQNKQAVRDIDQLDLLAFSRAKDIAAPYKVEVDESVRQWAEAVFLLKGKGSLLDAVKFYIEHGGPELTPCKVSAAVKELLALKEAQGLSGGQQAAVKSRLNRFAEVFGERDLHSLTVKEVENFILGLNVGGIARNHFRAALGNLFVFAQSRRYDPKDFNPAKEVKRATFSNAAAPTWAEIVSFETNVANSNADFGRLGYAMTPTARGKLKTTAKAANQAIFIWEKDAQGRPGFGEVNSYPAIASLQVPAATNVIFGNWSDLIVADWADGMDVVVDPYSLSAQGQVQVVVTHLTDSGIRHAASFCVSTNGIT